MHSFGEDSAAAQKYYTTTKHTKTQSATLINITDKQPIQLPENMLCKNIHDSMGRNAGVDKFSYDGNYIILKVAINCYVYFILKRHHVNLQLLKSLSGLAASSLQHGQKRKEQRRHLGRFYGRII